MEDDVPEIDQRSLINYIQTALSLSGANVSSDLIESILTLELEFLQHHGIVEEAVADPRPEL